MKVNRPNRKTIDNLLTKSETQKLTGDERSALRSYVKSSADGAGNSQLSPAVAERVETIKDLLDLHSPACVKNYGPIVITGNRDMGAIFSKIRLHKYMNPPLVHGGRRYSYCTNLSPELAKRLQHKLGPEKIIILDKGLDSYNRPVDGVVAVYSTLNYQQTHNHLSKLNPTYNNSEIS